ncbi:helix-turn-helix domain-containing protein [Streptomyces sp. NPDC001601]|uniref:helix-turn-helix domain-containing protein n=1 Tax=Streptomyces sp. NPDC001601 TaxID=3364592 RepID=UPI00367CD471
MNQVEKGRSRAMGHLPGRSHWRTLPPTLPAAYRDLVDDLRDLKDRSRLSLTELGQKTAISRSSWERYVNAKQFPPRHAVQALCRAVQADEETVLSTWERADAEWNRRGNTAAPAGPGPDQTTAHPRGSLDDTEPEAPGRLVHRALLAASVLITERPRAAAAAVLLLCTAMLVPAEVIHADYGTGPASAARPPICRLRSCEGRDPLTTACEDPVTVGSRTAADGTRLEIRLSPSCQAGWVRGWPTHRGFRIEITSPEGRVQAAATPTAMPTAGEMVTTTMIAAAHATGLRCCYYPSAGRPGRECFTAGS